MQTKSATSFFFGNPLDVVAHCSGRELLEANQVGMTSETILFCLHFL
jgi:hypothetical protein